MVAASEEVFSPVRVGNCINIPENRLEIKISDEELTKRLKNFTPKQKPLSGYLKRYAAAVSSGATGAILN